MSRRNYEQLDTAGQVRVNAHILSYFRNNPNGFIPAFRGLVAESTLDDRAAAFQGVLDSLRDVMAKNVAYLPPLEGGSADAHTLGQQRIVLRQIKIAMGEETLRYKHTTEFYGALVTQGSGELPQPRHAISMNPMNWLSVVAAGTIHVSIAPGSEGQGQQLAPKRAGRER